MNQTTRFKVLGEHCPLCNAPLLTDGDKKWCSFLGTAVYPACPYGRAGRVPFDAAGDR